MYKDDCLLLDSPVGSMPANDLAPPPMPDFGEVFEGFSEQECDAATYDGARATAIWLKNYTKGFLRSDWDNEDLELPQCSFSLIPGAISGYNVTCTTKNAPYTLCDTIDPHQLPNHDHAPFAPETPPTNSLVDYHNAFLRESGWNISCEDQSHPDPTPHTAPFDEGSSANHTILSFTYPTSFPSTAEPAGARVLNNGPLEVPASPVPQPYLPSNRHLVHFVDQGVLCQNIFSCSWNTCNQTYSLTASASEDEFQCSVYEHLLEHKRSLAEGSDRRYYCQWASCHKNYKEEKGLKRHISSNNHTVNKLCMRHFCNICDRSWARLETLNKHKLDEHST